MSLLYLKICDFFPFSHRRNTRDHMRKDEIHFRWFYGPKFVTEHNNIGNNTFLWFKRNMSEYKSVFVWKMNMSWDERRKKTKDCKRNRWHWSHSAEFAAWIIINTKNICFSKSKRRTWRTQLYVFYTLQFFCSCGHSVCHSFAVDTSHQ